MNTIQDLVGILEERVFCLVKGEKDTDELRGDFKLLRKQIRNLEFKLNRTVTDKDITTKVLKNTITKLELKSQNLEKQKLLTEEQARFKEELFTNVSHELRTPLHGIMGMSHLLENTTLNQVQRNYVEITKSSANNLLVIINDILSLSQINAGKARLLNKPFCTETFFRDLTGVLEFKAKKKDLSLIFVKSPAFPAFLCGDRTRLYQILLNLLNNAVKFTHHGHVSLNIFILNRTETSVDLQFDITDTGIGMERDKLASVFESFTQVHQNTSHIYEGAGLGLNIVKKLLNLMEGTIRVDSQPGQGTTFSVNLTLELPTDEAVKQYISAGTDLIIPPHWKYKRMLMIEDNPANLVYAKSIFESWGIELDIAENLAQTAAKTTTIKYDCILSDVKLPDGSGLEYIAGMRAQESALNQNTPVIVLTASANEKEADYSRSINVQSYIGKPFPPELLVSELKKILDRPVKKRPKSSAAETEEEEEGRYFAKLNKNFKNRNDLKVEMMDIFLQQIPLAVEKMAESLDAGDMETFHYEAHRIKSTINIIGLPRLQKIIARIDEYCYKKIHTEQIPDLFQRFLKQTDTDVQRTVKEREKLLTPMN